MFLNIVGHDRIKQQLKRDVETRKPHHAYLFSGPEHVGKMTLLTHFLSQLQSGRDFSPDSALAQHIASGQGPGLISLMDDGESLKIEQVRHISEMVSRRTAEGGFSFCIIEHVERMTRPATNAFLKILEEPSERFIYLMTTRREKKLLPTFLSRVQVYRFSSLPERQVRHFLETKESNPLLIEEVLALSAGRLGLALRLLQDEALLEKMRRLSDFAKVLMDHDLVERFALADHLSKEEWTQEDLSHFLLSLTVQLKREGMERFAAELDQLQRVQRLFLDTQVNKRLFLEQLFLQLPS